MPSPFPWITREKQVVQLSALPPSCSSRAQEKLFWKGQGVCLCAFPCVAPCACVQCLRAVRFYLSAHRPSVHAHYRRSIISDETLVQDNVNILHTKGDPKKRTPKQKIPAHGHLICDPCCLVAVYWSHFLGCLCGILRHPSPKRTVAFSPNTLHGLECV